MLTEDDGAQPVDYEVKRFRPHPNYSKRKQSNDIAVIELKTVVTFTEFIRPACLDQGHPNKVYSVIAVSDLNLCFITQYQKFFD